MAEKPQKPQEKSEKDTKNDRLGAALRANLQRRKAAASAREEE